MRTYELRLTATVSDIIEAIKNAKGTFHRELVSSLHDIVCSGEKISREDLLAVKGVAKELNHELMIMDCDSRLRNIVGN